MTNGYWEVLDAERGIFNHEYRLGRNRGTANTLALRLKKNELCVISPPDDVDDGAFAELERHGRPVALVAPNGFHHLGQPAWQARYPDARMFAPRAWKARIAKQQPGLRDCEPVEALEGLLPPDVWIGEPPHLRRGDVIARVDGADGAFWYFTDLVMNLRELPENLAIKLLFKWTRSGPGLSMCRALFPLLVKDKRGLESWLLDQVARHPPRMVLTGHGPAIVDAQLAATLPDVIDRAL